MATLQEQIEIILNEEKRSYHANGRDRGGLGSFNFGLPGVSARSGQIPDLLSPKSQAGTVQSKVGDILLKLFSSLSPHEKDQFNGVLLSQMNSASPYSAVAYFLFFGLWKTGALEDALRTTFLNLRSAGDHAFDNTMAMLALIITHEYKCLADDDYKQIESLFKGVPEYNHWIKDRLNAARLKIIEK